MKLARILLPLAIAVIASAQTIVTFAGNGTDGYTGDGGQATQAEINDVVGLATDAAGNVYMADQNNNRIRKVDTNGIITTFAGTGTAGFSGDGGPASQAELNGPTGVCISPAGIIYVNDLNNYRIRAISTSGTITTVAGNGNRASSGDGGPATSAEMVIPIRCAADGKGNLFIADQGAATVRKVDSGGTITTYAGTGVQGFSGDGGPATAAELNNPTWVTADGSGNLYVSDQFNQRVRVINSSGTITTVAGNGNAGFAGDGGPATAASLNYPGGTVLDASGALYIVDPTNNRVRKVTGGTITTIAGNGTAGYNGDGGPPLQAEFDNPFPLAIDAAANLYIGDLSNDRVRKITGEASQAPVITGVVNGASFQAGTVPNSWITINGTNLYAGPAATWTVINGALPTTLNGVTVSVGGQPAYVYYVSATQINVVAPNVGTGNVTVTVKNSAGTSNAFTAVSQTVQPAFFLWPGGYSVATHQDFTYAIKNGTFAGVTTTPASPGETIILWGTGFGPTTPAFPVGIATPSTTAYLSGTVTVTIGGVSASVYQSSAALAANFASLYQLAVTVPSSLAAGDYPVVATINGVQSPTTTMLTVQ
jgi:uncharacterized protein (TIGR03437 family)